MSAPQRPESSRLTERSFVAAGSSPAKIMPPTTPSGFSSSSHSRSSTSASDTSAPTGMAPTISSRGRPPLPRMVSRLTMSSSLSAASAYSKDSASARAASSMPSLDARKLIRSASSCSSDIGGLSSANLRPARPIVAIKSRTAVGVGASGCAGGAFRCCERAAAASAIASADGSLLLRRRRAAFSRIGEDLSIERAKSPSRSLLVRLSLLLRRRRAGGEISGETSSGATTLLCRA
eukprot:scaffold28188_cov66-Phaeocystis_antarctica.AAC.15